MENIEVVTSVQRHRRWTLPDKRRAVDELNVAEMTVSYVAGKYGVSPGLLFRGRSSYLKVETGDQGRR
ncbi:transposase [Noviherbaspirillum album]|uniref:transposase n=1 Tax=Noviherbaspirillum album TaxID=3080276 RepID=UPI003F58FCD7